MTSQSPQSTQVPVRHLRYRPRLWSFGYRNQSHAPITNANVTVWELSMLMSLLLLLLLLFLLLSLLLLLLLLLLLRFRLLQLLLSLRMPLLILYSLILPLIVERVKHPPTTRRERGRKAVEGNQDELHPPTKHFLYPPTKHFFH